LNAGCARRLQIQAYERRLSEKQERGEDLLANTRRLRELRETGDVETRGFNSGETPGISSR
jgi:hypothetical protein